MEPSEDHPSTRECLTSLKNKPHKQLGQLSTQIPARIVSQCVQLPFDGEKCVLLLRVRKADFFNLVTYEVYEHGGITVIRIHICINAYTYNYANEKQPNTELGHRN